jgi:hypothetical protein
MVEGHSSYDHCKRIGGREMMKTDEKILIAKLRFLQSKVRDGDGFETQEQLNGILDGTPFETYSGTVYELLKGRTLGHVKNFHGMFVPKWTINSIYQEGVCWTAVLTNGKGDYAYSHREVDTRPTSLDAAWFAAILEAMVHDERALANPPQVISKKVQLEKILSDVIDMTFFCDPHASDIQEKSKHLFGFYAAMHEVQEAFSGCIDAANRVLNKSLPGHGIEVWATADETRCRVYKEEEECVTTAYSANKYQSRAILMAVLRELIELCDADE